VIGLLLIEGMLRLGLIKNRQYYYLTPAGERLHPDGRLLILGDSFVMKGGPMDAVLLKELASYHLAVWNFAKPATGPFDALIDAKENVRNVRPDIILMCLFVGNDISDTERFLDSHANETGLRRLRRALLRRLYLYRFLRYDLTRGRVPEFPKNPEVDPAIMELYRKGRLPNPWWLMVSPKHKARLVGDNLLLNNSASQRATDAIEGAIREVHRLCQEVGSQLLVVVFPDTLQVSRDNFDFFHKLGVALDDRTLVTDLPQRRWKAVGDSLGVPVVDMLPEFRNRRSQRLYLQYDMHLNEAGNALAAELIMKSLPKLLPRLRQQ
jgi:hypothetical protein